MGELAELHTQKPVPELFDVSIDLPENIVRVVEKCLAKDPAKRYADGDQLLEDLRDVLAHLRDVDTLVSDALDILDVSWSGRDGRYEVTVPTQAGRSQRVFVESASGGPITDRLVKIYSVCAPLHEGYYRRALELNADMPHGSIAIQDIDGRPYFIMIDTYPRSTCDPEELRRSVLTIARWSDDIEKVLTGGDSH